MCVLLAIKKKKKKKKKKKRLKKGMNSKLAKNRKKDEQNLVSICCKQSLKKYLNFDSVDRKIKIKQSYYYFFVEPGKKPMPFLST